MRAIQPMSLKFEKRVVMGKKRVLGFQAKRKTEIRTRNGGFGDEYKKSSAGDETSQDGSQRRADPNSYFDHSEIRRNARTAERKQR